ncbi:MAG: hypothetical protein ACTSRG_04550 [Candidatus Helarchaeota archaeon]
MENQRLLGFFLVLGGVGIIIFIFMVISPFQMENAKNYLLYLFSITSYSQPYPDPFKESLTTIIFVSVFQSFQQIENNTLYIYLGVCLAIFGAILMFFEGVTFEILEDEEAEDEKNSLKSVKQI